MMTDEALKILGRVIVDFGRPVREFRLMEELSLDRGPRYESAAQPRRPDDLRRMLELVDAPPSEG